MTSRRRDIFAVAVSLLLTLSTLSCQRTPKGVLDTDDMAELMADIHIGESVVDNEYIKYDSDSVRKALKQAILERHGVTQADFDTSLVWYGHHLDKYIEVYEQTSEILQKRLDMAGAVGGSSEGVAVAGDSVDVWTGARRFEIGPNTPSNIVTFSLKHDANWKNGDSYTWRVKLHNMPAMAQWSINAEYSDGSTEVLSTMFAGEGWHEITFFADSTRQATRIFGDLTLTPGPGRRVYADSVELIRNRLIPSLYMQRYRQRLYDLRKKQ